MIKQILLLVIPVALIRITTSCDLFHKKSNTMEKPTSTLSANDTTPKVIGIGGIFFFTDDPKATKEWYSQNLGMEINDWGSSSFESRDINHPDTIQSLQWTPFKTGSDYFEPSKKDFMINYRVQNLEGLVEKLKQNGANILDSIAVYDYGKFVHLIDPEGNKIELWEPK